MIDSVTLTLPRRMHARRDLFALGFFSACGHGERVCRHPARWKLNLPTAEVTLPRITWSEAPDRSHWLTASVSVPKMLWGSNIGSLETDVEIVTGLSAISRFVTQASGIDFEAAEANVTRVDYCFNWQLTPSEVWQYLRALMVLRFPA